MNAGQTRARDSERPDTKLVSGKSKEHGKVAPFTPARPGQAFARAFETAATVLSTNSSVAISENAPRM